jgi:two-component system alkaline phosphatase synthesis response regulator PhoP
MSSRILLVDDDKDILEILQYNLRKEGYEIATTEDGVEAIKIASSFLPHLIILDVMMPKMDGIDCCLKLRSIPEMKDVIITFLTARSEDYSQIAGLEAGADDYISKTVKPKVLISKVQSLLRRYKRKTIIEFLDIIIDTEKHRVLKNGVEMKFAKKEFDLLCLLFSDTGRLFKREEIMRKVWGTESFVGDRTIDVHIRKLRQKLGEDLISTIKGVGYQINEK